VNRDLGTTTAIITHNVVQAEMAQRVILLSDGVVTDIRVNATPRPPAELTW
jgi:putative ABC transport system ATP-binding protein